MKLEEIMTIPSFLVKNYEGVYN